MTTAAPHSASRLAIAAPMPRDAPVTRARQPEKSVGSCRCSPVMRASDPPANPREPARQTVRAARDDDIALPCRPAAFFDPLRPAPQPDSPGDGIQERIVNPSYDNGAFSLDPNTGETDGDFPRAEMGRDDNLRARVGQHPVLQSWILVRDHPLPAAL